jgi:hypothetical protein
VARNAPGVVRAATPADEMDKTVNVSVMEGLNTGVRGNNRNRHCDSEHNNGVRLDTPAGAVGRSFCEALCIQLFGGPRQTGWLRVRRPEVGDVQGLRPVWLEVGELPRPTQMCRSKLSRNESVVNSSKGAKTLHP